MLKAEIIKDKKAEKIMAELNGADINKAKSAANAVSDTVNTSLLQHPLMFLLLVPANLY